MFLISHGPVSRTLKWGPFWRVFSGTLTWKSTRRARDGQSRRSTHCETSRHCRYDWSIGKVLLVIRLTTKMLKAHSLVLADHFELWSRCGRAYLDFHFNYFEVKKASIIVTVASLAHQQTVILMPLVSSLGNQTTNSWTWLVSVSSVPYSSSLALPGRNMDFSSIDI